MKTLKITLLFTMMSLGIFAQNYQPITTQDTVGVWSVWEEKLVFQGDSILENNTYKKLWRYQGEIINYDSLSYVGLIRQDSAQGKVWLAKPGFSEKIILDMSLNVYDTLRVYPALSPVNPFWRNADSSVTIRVDRVDTVLVNGMPRRSLSIVFKNGSSHKYENWIEGMGSTAGIAYAGLGNPIGTLWPEILLCYTESSVLMYQNDMGFGCFTAPTFGIEEDVLSSAIRIYPNPASDYINITMSLPELQNAKATARLYNLVGQELLKQEIEFKNGKVIISLSKNNLQQTGEVSQSSQRHGGKISTGNYIIELKTKTHLFTEKIMIR